MSLIFTLLHKPLEGSLVFSCEGVVPSLVGWDVEGKLKRAVGIGQVMKMGTANGFNGVPKPFCPYGHTISLTLWLCLSVVSGYCLPCGAAN